MRPFSRSTRTTFGSGVTTSTSLASLVSSSAVILSFFLIFVTTTTVEISFAAVPNRGTANVNGVYRLANPLPNGPSNFSLPARAKGRYFDVYSDVVHSLYSQVNWRTHTTPIPSDVVAKFSGRTMNIVGYEFNIIRRRGGGACVSSSSDSPVPCDFEPAFGWEQYNHHYTNTISGAALKLVRTEIPETDPGMSHTGSHPGHEFVVADPAAAAAAAAASAPTSQFLPMGNGAESRLTLHLFPPGYGALIHSPTTHTVTPMIIDTKARNRTDNSTRHGPVPNNSNVGPDAMYSGLMECPCTDLYPKVPAKASTLSQGTCGAAGSIKTAQACFDAASSLGLVARANRTLSSATYPAGCAATAVVGGFDIVFNDASSSSRDCGFAPGETGRRVGMFESEETIRVEVDVEPAVLPKSPSLAGAWQIAGPIQTGHLVTIAQSSASGNFTATCSSSSTAAALPSKKCFAPVTGPVRDGKYYAFSIPGTIRTDGNQVTFSNGVILNRWWPAIEPASALAGNWKVTAHPQDSIFGTDFTISGPNDRLSVASDYFPSPGVGAVVADGTQLRMPNWPTAAIQQSGNRLTFTNGVVFERLNPDVGTGGSVTVTMRGPADVWFGAGFMDALPVATPGSRSKSAMEGTYSIIALGNGSVVERQLAYHAPGNALASSLSILNNSVVDGVRTLVVTRPMAGASPAHYSFRRQQSKAGLIAAVGYTPTFSQHKAHSADTLFFVDAGAPTCLCDLMPPMGSTSSQGTIGGGSFRTNCQPRPLGEMLDDDAWRNTSSWYTNNNGVNPTCDITHYKGGLKCCHDGTLITDTPQARDAIVAANDTDYYQTFFRYYYEDPQELTTPITDTYWSFWWTENNNGEHDVPPCYNEQCLDTITSNFTGAQLPGARPNVDSEIIHYEGHCHIGCQRMELWNVDDPHNPKLLCRTAIDYGSSDNVLDEEGYILGNRPCIFGFQKDGFQEPPIIRSDTKLMSVKVQNNTVSRYGDMALIEARFAYRSSNDNVVDTITSFN